MKIILLLLSIFSFSAFSQWENEISNSLGAQGLSQLFPDTQHLGRWNEHRDFILTSRDPRGLFRRGFSCANGKLFPTHPSQATKEYQYAVWSQYDHSRLSPSSYACLTVSPPGRHCLRAAVAIMVILSDTFQDECGNFFRGYWLQGYLKSDENMGTLASRGRTFYPKPNSPFPNDFEEGGTYAVEPKSFLFLAELEPGDQGKISTEIQRALRTGFRREGFLFVK